MTLTKSAWAGQDSIRRLNTSGRCLGVRIPRRIVLRGAITAVTFLAAAAAAAQSPEEPYQPYAGFTLLASMERHSHSVLAGGLDSPNTNTAGFGASVGTFVTPRVMLTLEIDVPGEVATGHFATTPAGGVQQVSDSAARSVSESVLIGFRTHPRARISLGFLGGASFFEFRSRNTRVSIAPSKPPEVRESESISYATGVVIGIDASVALVRHVAIVPFFRIHGVSRSATLQDVILRPGVSVRWQF